VATNKYTGAQKAAILLLSFGEEISAEIFKHMTEFEIKRIGGAMSRLGRLEHEIIDSLALGSSANLDSLELIDSKTLANFVRNEHPQTIALILAHLDPKKMGEVLKQIPEALHTEVLLRVANLEAVAPEIIDEIDDVLRNEIQALGSISSAKIGGVEPLAEMLNLIDKATEEQILDNLEERDPDLAEEIRQLMFVFDDLVKIDERGIQELVKNVSNDKWKVALKTASESVSSLIFKNMSERAAQMLKEDMEAMSAVKLTDVEEAQFAIVQVARKLEEEGKIIIATGDSTYV